MLGVTFACTGIAAGCICNTASADDAGNAAASQSATTAPVAAEASVSKGFWPDLWTRQTLLGDMGGLRPWFDKYGASLALTENSEYWGNLRGGLHHGGAYDGVTTLTFGLDTSKALGIPGGQFNVSALQIHGTSITRANLGTMNMASNDEAPASTRLWELWYQQTLLNKRVDVKIGQQSLDQEFMTSQYGATFINAEFGWSALSAYDLPAGGPAYPLAAPGVRVRAKITPSLTALAGVFDGNPTGNNPDNESGTNFNLHDGALYIGELQYAVNPPGDDGKPRQGGGLPGTYKIGVWYNNGRFADQRYAANGQSLALGGVGGPHEHHGDYSIYAVADQMLWRPDPDKPRALGAFARVTGAPGDRNLVNLAATAGLVLSAPFKGRDNDSMGIAVTYIKVGNHAHDLDLDYLSSGAPYGVRTSETTLEATYIWQVTPWWTLQADAQYTFNAGAGQNPDNPAVPLRNTFVLGLRTNIVF